MRTTIAALACLALAGCAPTLIGANAAGGVVQVGLSNTEAFKTANAHCQTVGKIARVTATSVLAETMTFDCVAQ